MRNLDLIGILLAGLTIGCGVTALAGWWYDRRKSNVVDLDHERAQRREPSNVTPFVRREGVRVVPLPRKWGA